HNGLVSISGAAEVQLTNCIAPMTSSMFIIFSGAGKKSVRLRNNTLFSGNDYCVVSAHPTAELPITIEAEGNIFGAPPCNGDKKAYHWKGKDNLYVGQTLDYVLLEDKTLTGLARWKKHWGDDE